MFSAFVAAEAISKANADDPKKTSLVRCARTDKGVHAAGNLISLKLIVEDPNIVAKINEHLSPQIRVWGIERTNGSFSAYQFCDSRIYEYLIPTHCFLPPHPNSFLGKKMVELAEEAGDTAGYLSRQEEVLDFWSEAEQDYEKPAIELMDPGVRDAAIKAFHEHETVAPNSSNSAITDNMNHDHLTTSLQGNSGFESTTISQSASTDGEQASTSKEPKTSNLEQSPQPQVKPTEHSKEPSPFELAVRKLKAAHIAARKAYRIHPARLDRVRSCLSRFGGTHKYHNYTIDKTFKDPSASRIIKTFKVGEKPIVIGDTEWLSLKVHGQSFMMHQIRKMVSMVALIIRCGCPEDRLEDSYFANRISIPKAPSLGLLLERPVFEAYNVQLEQFGREKIDFARHEKEMDEFKQREIYERIFREEEKDACFHSFFTGLDNTRSAQLFYLSSLGVDAIKRDVPRISKVVGSTDVDLVLSNDEDVDGEDNSKDLCLQGI